MDWDSTVERLDAGSAPAPDANYARSTWLTTLNDDGSTSCDCGRCAVAGRIVLVPVRLWHAPAPQHRARPALQRRRLDSRCGRRRSHRSTSDGTGDIARAAKAGRTAVGRSSPIRAAPVSTRPSMHIARPAAMARVPHRQALGDGRHGCRAGRSHPISGLTARQGRHPPQQSPVIVSTSTVVADGCRQHVGEKGRSRGLVDVGSHRARGRQNLKDFAVAERPWLVLG